MFRDTEEKIRRGNKILFGRDSLCLFQILASVEQMDRRALILWALEGGQQVTARIEAMDPAERRPRLCLEKCRDWAEGRILMRQAKEAILAVHRAAKQSPDPVFCALCHAVGQAGSTVHAKGHASGLMFYDLTAIVLELKGKDYEEAVLGRIMEYQERLKFWEQERRKNRPWAGFLQQG